MSLPTLTHDGQTFVLGCLPGPLLCGFPLYADHFEVLRADQLIDIDLSYGLPIENQQQTSACTGYSSAKAAATSHAIRSGGDQVRLSPGYLYSKVNGGRDQGADIASLLKAAQQYGWAPYEQFPEYNLYAGQGLAGADQAAGRFRLEEAYLLTSVQQALSAIVHGMPVVAGWMIGSNFPHTDAEGVSPPPQDMLGGHALPATEVYHSPRYGLCIGGDNSWGPTFGRAGRYRLPVSGYANGPFQAFALKALQADPAVDGPKARHK